MAQCFFCNEALNLSEVVVKGQDEYKSCPNCSVQHGFHIFYRTGDFGNRNMGDGRIVIQSWCPDCRVKESVRRVPSSTCQDIASC